MVSMTCRSRFSDVFKHPLKPDINEITALGYLIPCIPIYNLRATFASRLSASGTPGQFVAQMLGHSGTRILHVYAKAIDESRREAMKKLEAYRKSHQKESGSDASDSPNTRQTAITRHPCTIQEPYLN